MRGYKEFEGKTLDEAIRGACAYYDATRDKLEIEIVSDAKGGIFGLVGAKKARVRARLVELSSVLEDLDSSLGAKSKSSKKRTEALAGESTRGVRREQEPDQTATDESAAGEHRRTGKRDGREETPRHRRQEKPVHLKTNLSHDGDIHEETPVQQAPQSEEVPEAKASRPSRSAKAQRQERLRDGRRSLNAESRPGNGAGNATRPANPPQTVSADASLDLDLDGEEFSRVPLDQLDPAVLENAAREIVSQLTVSFLGEVAISTTIASDRVRITLTDVEDPGLLIGRDGQTLASLQYLVTRMLSNRMKALLRVQIDAGDYRERQDDRLREMAMQLAEKVKAGGRPQVTRPLTSYHRRIIHLTLQNDPLVQTHSKGEGEMKRVMVARRKTAS